jgi:radical SAM protein with 4Fe4S-binding SPASM domain
MTLDEFRRVIDSLPGIRHVEMNGLGEPLLNPHLLEMIAYANRKALQSAFFTNATLLTPEIADRLVHAPGLIEIKVSIDTADPEEYAALRVGADLGNVLANLGALVRMRNESGGIVPAVTVSMTAMPRYIRGIPRLVESLRDVGIHALQVKDVFSLEGTLHNDRLSAEDRARIDEYQRVYAKEDFRIIHLRGTSVNRVETRTCIAPWHTLYVNAAGGVQPCCFTPFREMIFGNLLETEFRNLWNNDAYRAFRHELKTGVPKPCAICPAHGQTWIHPPAMAGE